MFGRTILFGALTVTVAAAFACSGSSGGSGGGGGSSGSSGSGSSGGSSGGVAGWPGTYSCMQTRSYTLGDAGGTPTTSMSTGTVDVTQNGSEVTVTAASDSGPPCAIKATVNGNSATVEPNQMCMVMSGPILATITITSGSGMLSADGKSVTTMFAFNIDSPLTGTGTESASCTRM